MAHSTEHSALRERLQQKEVEVTALTSLIHKQGRSLHNFSQSSVDREVPSRRGCSPASQHSARLSSPTMPRPTSQSSLPAVKETMAKQRGTFIVVSGERPVTVRVP